jgi:multidrug resistance efflux pump
MYIVGAHIMQIASLLAGKTVRGAMQDNPTMRRGELLFGIDPEPHLLAMSPPSPGNCQARVAA